MRTVITILAACLVGSVVQAQTVSVDPSAQYMPLQVFDAKGKLVAGAVAEPDWSFPGRLPITLRYHSPLEPTTTKGDTFSLRIVADASGSHLRYIWFTVNTGDAFYFESTDCTGQAYLDAGRAIPGRRMALLDHASNPNLLYLSEPDPVVVVREYHSSRPAEYPDCVNQIGNILAAAIAPVIDLDDVFTLPFRVN
jgi:hypothetical protein